MLYKILWISCLLLTTRALNRPSYVVKRMQHAEQRVEETVEAER